MDRYCHILYALDPLLGDLRHPTAGRLEAAMKGHVLASAGLIDMYGRAQ